MYKLWMKFKVCKNFFKVFFKEDIGDIDGKIKKVSDELSKVQ